MSALEQIAYFLNIRNEKPNQALAKKLAENNDREGIREIVDGLNHKEKNVQSDCIKVLYETGYLKPELIAEYAEKYISLLHSKNNRMVWGGMIALMTIAEINAEPILNKVDEIIEVIKKGSVITQDAGVKAIAAAIATDEDFRQKYTSFLIDHFEKSLPRDIPRLLEHLTPIIKDDSKEAFQLILNNRIAELKPSQITKAKKNARKLGIIIE